MAILWGLGDQEALRATGEVDFVDHEELASNLVVEIGQARNKLVLLLDERVFETFVVLAEDHVLSVDLQAAIIHLLLLSAFGPAFVRHSERVLLDAVNLAQSCPSALDCRPHSALIAFFTILGYLGVQNVAQVRRLAKRHDRALFVQLLHAFSLELAAPLGQSRSLRDSAAVFVRLCSLFHRGVLGYELVNIEDVLADREKRLLLLFATCVFWHFCSRASGYFEGDLLRVARDFRPPLTGLVSDLQRQVGFVLRVERPRLTAFVFQAHAFCRGL